MKIAAILLGLLLCAAALFIHLADAKKSMDMGSELSELLDQVPEEARGAIEGEGLPSPGRLKLGGLLSLLAALGSVLIVAFTFTKKTLQAKAIAAALGVAALAAIVYPTVQTGAADGMAPRLQAMVGLGIVAVQAACFWFVASRPRRS